MSLFTNFRHSLTFTQPDPLGDGLAEEIAAEQAEPDAITLEETPDMQTFTEQWDHMVNDLHNDPDWVSFSNDED